MANRALSKKRALMRPIAIRRPALTGLIAAMERLSRRQRIEIAALDRRAKAAKAPRLRRLAREAREEAKRLTAEAR
jgi:hypothetical protein